jgi:DUF3043 family protein
VDALTEGTAGSDGQPAGSADSAPAAKAVTASKGKPTPKRSEAEQRRRQSFGGAPPSRRPAPRNRKEASQERSRRMEAMRKGEEWALPAKDRGAARALARDYVDSKWRVSEFYMYGLLVLMALLFVRSPAVQTTVPLVVLAAVVVMLIEGILLGYRVRALAQQRVPGESTRGIRLYAAMRALQIRQLRVPKPRIRPGGEY